MITFKIISHFAKSLLLNCFTGSSTVVQTLETKHSKVIRCQYGQKLPANTASAEDFVYKDEVLDTFQ